MMVAPMRAELTQVGFEELTTAEQVVSEMDNAEGTKLVVFNSVCGCAAGTCRPGIRLALQNTVKKPGKLFSAFAGMETAAVAKAREYTLPFPPSSPSIALFKDGELVHMVERHHIEGRSPEQIASNLIGAFEQYC